MHHAGTGRLRAPAVSRLLGEGRDSHAQRQNFGEMAIVRRLDFPLFFFGSGSASRVGIHRVGKCPALRYWGSANPILIRSPRSWNRGEHENAIKFAPAHKGGLVSKKSTTQAVLKSVAIKSDKDGHRTIHTTLVSEYKETVLAHLGQHVGSTVEATFEGIQEEMYAVGNK